jgi:Zn-dependent oligopeptidase
MASLLRDLNQSYLAVHIAKEEAFWSNKMGLKSYVQGSFETAEMALRDFMSDDGALPRVRKELERQDLSSDERTGLEGWRKFFEVNIIEKPEAKALQKRIIELEGKLEQARRAMKLGYIDPQTGERVASDSMGLSLLMRTSENEALRRAAHAGLKEIEAFVLSHGFIELVQERNRLGRMLGYEDYYDFKVSRNEGFSKKELFTLLDELERDTRQACANSIEKLKKEKGPSASEAWNFGFYSSGSITKLLDPYFQFQSALGRWGRSFMNLGIRYQGSSLTLDLLSRTGKYENGFMHGPFPAYVEQGKFLPAKINFTSLGTPGQLGSGNAELNTLFHEGGHAAHFSNIAMPAPCFAQEFAPTSVAFAETQSMFCDSLVRDADWRTRYAKDHAGQPVPLELIQP